MAQVANFPKKKTKKTEAREIEKSFVSQPLANKIIAERDYYLASRRGRSSIWTKCWKAYMSWIDTTKNPFLANLFIPKTHEAVELLAAFLAGPNQSITAEAEGREDTKKAILVKKWLEFQWRKVLKARAKIITWIKQTLLFGNGIIKVGWNEEANEPFLSVISLTNVYFDYFYRDLQDSPSVIHAVKRLRKNVKGDERYDEKVRKQIISKSEMMELEEERSLASYDETILSTSSEDETILYERWTKERCITIGPTSTGWQILRDMENPNEDSDGNKFIPFVKVRLKNNPLPNRAYDIGAVEPTLKIQMAFNDMMNEVFDNVSLINNVTWIKRRGANINPMDLVRRPGQIITVEDNVVADIRAESVPDIKASSLKVLEMLDAEFQQASMVVNLLKGIPGAEFATEAALGQSNVMTLLEPVDMNIKDALSELGQMILNINLAHAKKIPSLKVLENDEEEVWAEFKPGEIKGKYDIRIEADRQALIPAAVKQKQYIDFMSLLARDPETRAKYPDLMTKLYKQWLRHGGEGDIEYYFEEPKTEVSPPIPATITGGPITKAATEAPTPRKPAPAEGLTTPAIIKSVMEAAMPKGKT